jgi:ABC-2 type transport system ATP-binding protein
MHALTILNLQKTYPNGVAAVKGVDLSVEQGDFFALLGPNGAGKTTIIGIISSLVNKTAGSVKIFGHDLETDLIAAKCCMGLVPQEINFNMFEKVIDIVVNQAGFYGISRKLALVRAEKYLRQLGLWEKRNEISRTLSGGMKRRLMIARALVHEPKMLILDEPTAGVDIELRRSTWDFLQEINGRGVTIILTTHNLEEAEYLCRGIAIIHQGVILEKTVMKELLTQLENETIVLDLVAPLLAEEIPQIENSEVSLIDAHTLQVTFPKSLNLNSVFKALSDNNIQVHSMRNKTNRLEELFLRRIQQNNSLPLGTSNAH